MAVITILAQVGEMDPGLRVTQTLSSLRALLGDERPDLSAD
ncbi:hypothetical protein [Mycobacterium marinum]